MEIQGVYDHPSGACRVVIARPDGRVQLYGTVGMTGLEALRGLGMADPTEVRATLDSFGFVMREFPVPEHRPERP